MRYLVLFPLAFLLQGCGHFFTKTQASVGLGNSQIIGADSWGDPVGEQVSIESRVVEINKQSALRLGLGLSHQGAWYTEPGLSGKVFLYYLNIPFLYSYEGRKGFYFEGGLQPNVLLISKDKYLGVSHDYKDQTKKLEIGVPVGAGYRTKNGIGLGIRVIPGLTPAFNDDNSSRNLLVMLRASVNLSGHN